MIALTPLGVSINQAVLAVVDDMVISMVDEVSGYDPDCNDVKIFLDVVVFIPDYPVLSHLVAFLGHNDSAPCSLCTLRRQPAVDSSMYESSSQIHAESSADLRCWERQKALRQI